MTTIVNFVTSGLQPNSAPVTVVQPNLKFKAAFCTKKGLNSLFSTNPLSGT